MSDVAGSIWMETGTSMVWDPDALHAATQSGRVVSLREALEWVAAMPVEPPGGARTVVVTGLQTLLEVVPKDERDIVLKKVGRLVYLHSQRWGEAAIVFAVQDPGRFRVSPPSGSVMVKLEGGEEVEIGRCLWGGAAPEADRLVGKRRDQQGRESTIPIGYWLRRVG